ncbi:MAG: transcriptional repressor [Anaerolineae bacterium]|nr:transcriptional repressor [Anaerolineae bacterium]
MSSNVDAEDTARIYSDDRYEVIVERLREAGCRLTPQRLALVDILTHTDRHFSAQQLHERLRQRFPTTSLATVYKTLNTLRELGEVTEMGFSDDDTRYDAMDPHPHPHLVCIQCRRIIDAEVEPPDELAERLEQISGYRILSHRLEFYGICPECQSRQHPNTLSQEAASTETTSK